MGSNTYSNFVIKQGATFNQLLTWYADKNKTTLVNLTGYTARMQIRNNIEDASPIVDMTTANSKITLGGAAGTITLNIPATETSALTPGSAVYDLELVNGATVIRLLEGSLEITREVTR